MKNLDYSQIGKRIRAIRRNLGWTQEQLSEAAEISVPYLSHIERGGKKVSLTTLIGIADALSVTTDFLLFGRDNISITGFEALFSDCSDYEKSILLDTASAVKDILRKHRRIA